MKHKNLMKGLLFALITSIVSGIAIFYSKISVAKVDPLVLATARNLYVAMVFFAGMLIFGKLHEIKKLSKKNFTTLLIIGIIGGGIPFYLFFTGLQFIGAQSANILHKSLFIWVSLLAMVYLREKLNIIHWVGYLIVCIGTFLFTPVSFLWNRGTLMVLAATFLWATENIVAKKVLNSVSSEMVGLFRMGVGALFLLALTFMSGKGSLLIHLNTSQLTVITIGATILCFYIYFWYKSLKYAPASLVTLILTFSVVVGNILNGSFAGIKLAQKDLLASSIIASGVLLIYGYQIIKNNKISN